MKFFYLISLCLLLLNTGYSKDGRIHPTFKLLDSETNTCGVCHDTKFIKEHSGHYTDDLNPRCTQCHRENFKTSFNTNDLDKDGFVRKEKIDISVPTNSNCSSCHGIVHFDSSFVEIPDDYETSTFYDLSQKTGVIISGQKVNDSYLNIEAKEKQNRPWDVHAARKLSCTDCHYARNNPKRIVANKKLDHLKYDPRKLSTSEYLIKPDHRFISAQCTTCHDPMTLHDSFPYKKRHLEALSCQTCHITKTFAPLVESIDKTVLKENRTHVTNYRGLASKNNNLNIDFNNGNSPMLLEDIEGKISPFNIISTWNWSSENKEVDQKKLEQIYLKNGKYRKEIVDVFDLNKDNKIDSNELILDSDDKVDYIQNKLISLGVKNPKIDHNVDYYKINHGIMRGTWVQNDCYYCHGANSHLNKDILLSNRAPAKTSEKTFMKGEIYIKKDGSLNLRNNRKLYKRYILGVNYFNWQDIVGLISILATIFAVLFHARKRYVNRNKISHLVTKLKSVYMYSLYERIWHWTLALSIILLILTGFEIHYAGKIKIIGLYSAVKIHNVIAFIMLINAFLSLFYHLASSQIKQFFPPVKSILSDSIAQIKYYTSGIFRGEPHPLQKTPERKLNPLQQITYLGILNILLPLQVVTGILIWGIDKWPNYLDKFGGLEIISKIHTLGAWLFVAFILMHIYLTTTGHFILSNIKAMITGYDIVEKNEDDNEKI